MRQRDLAWMSIAVAASAACATTGSVAKSSPHDAPAKPTEVWTVAAPTRAPRPPSTTVRIEDDEAPSEPRGRDPGATSARPTRVGGRRIADVRLRDASIQDAMRLLADVGGFGLVLDPEIDGRVSLDLRGVDPFVALVTIADNNGAYVDVRDGLVVVRKR